MAGHKETYKGRAIEIAEHDDAEHDDAKEHELKIDGKPLKYHVAEDGSIESHDFMFRVFGSPAELARAVIDQGITS